MVYLVRLVLLCFAVVVHARLSIVLANGVREPSVSIQIEWGDGRPRAWSGTISVVQKTDARAPLHWRLLCEDHDAAVSIHAEKNTLFIHDYRPREHNGVEVQIADWRHARLAIKVAAQEEPQVVTEINISVAEVFANTVLRQLDGNGNRLTVSRSEDASLRIVHSDSNEPAHGSVYRGGETVRFMAWPMLQVRSGSSAPRELLMTVRDVLTEMELSVESRLIHADDAPAVPAGEGVEVRSFQPIEFEVELPEHDSVCEVAFEIVERSGFGWSRPVATHSIDLFVVDDEPLREPSEAWTLVYELDPASPRLHERLRRLSSTMSSLSVPALPLPSVKLPALPFPSMTRPNIPLPKMPNVPLPAVSSLVPRVSGLLSHGDSVVEPHPQGAVLRLPPVPSTDQPSWEGVVIAGAAVGKPHLVEIEYPRHQVATFGVSVLEVGASGGSVEQQYAGGFEVEPPVASDEPQDQLGRHAFVFWPSTANPVIALMNLSDRNAAVFGKVRVFAGPGRLPAMQAVSPTQPNDASDAVRPIHGFVDSPGRIAYGVGGRSVGQVEQLPAQGSRMLLGVRRSLEWLAAQGAGGAMVTVVRDGAAVWPSELTKDSPRWFGGVGVPQRQRDVLELLCRLYEREGMQFVPALSFNAPVPSLEVLLARGSQQEGSQAGILLVGEDGKPRRLSGRPTALHYNILDPRVQHVVESFVGEVIDRVGESRAVKGVSLVLSHDGWLHLPGVAWGLDDITFARFANDVGIESGAGEDRFSQRAAFVRGPGKDMWLSWRSRELSSFYSRLGGMVSVKDHEKVLYVAPTTLLSLGELASRLRPSLAEKPSFGAGFWREIGVDPASLANRGNIVFLSPHVHRTEGDLVGRGIDDRVNRSVALARGAVSARRRGAVAVEIPCRVNIGNIVPHGPFGSAATDGEVSAYAVRCSDQATRSWAESLVVGDAEIIFDMGMMFAQPSLSGVLARRAFASLPYGSLQLVDPLPAPLVVRAGESPFGAVLLVANASAVPVRAGLRFENTPSVVADAVDGIRMNINEDGGVSVPLEPWGIRSLVVDRVTQVSGAEVAFTEESRGWMRDRLEVFREQQSLVEHPRALSVLDNPDFEVPSSSDGVLGWEVVDQQRGSIGIQSSGRSEDGKAVRFSSLNGLATMRSNPFAPPRTGRISVSAWLRMDPDEVSQPPLRLAIEGLDKTGEYYRFAPIGGLENGRPLKHAWSQFVVQVYDLPRDGLESLRVRFDLMGPGKVLVDDIEVYGLAFNEFEQARFRELLSHAEKRINSGDIGGCALVLNSFWPQYLMANQSSDGEEGVDQPGGQPIARPPKRWTWR